MSGDSDLPSFIVKRTLELSLDYIVSSYYRFMDFDWLLHYCRNEWWLEHIGLWMVWLGFVGGGVSCWEDNDAFSFSVSESHLHSFLIPSFKFVMLALCSFMHKITELCHCDSVKNTEVDCSVEPTS